ncbi:hypothetical protein V499_02248 [Pseudogymnoascus sp. VKM F-103]|nr:hypothetical protein V499_02248 [Pseudogymnoascus sp. VKM F-103]
MMALKCDTELLHYLHCIKQVWSDLVRGNKAAMGKIDQATVKALELKAPRASTADAEFLRIRVAENAFVYGQGTRGDQVDLRYRQIIAPRIKHLQQYLAALAKQTPPSEHPPLVTSGSGRPTAQGGSHGRSPSLPPAAESGELPRDPSPHTVGSRLDRSPRAPEPADDDMGLFVPEAAGAAYEQLDASRARKVEAEASGTKKAKGSVAGEAAAGEGEAGEREAGEAREGEAGEREAGEGEAGERATRERAAGERAAGERDRHQPYQMGGQYLEIPNTTRSRSRESV